MRSLPHLRQQDGANIRDVKRRATTNVSYCSGSDGGAKTLLLDEPSLGLAPIIVDELCQVLQELNKNGLAILMVEQNTLIALEFAQRAYCLEGGTIALEGKCSDLLHNDDVRKIYLGIKA